MSAALRPSLCLAALFAAASSLAAQQSPTSAATSTVTRTAGNKQMTPADLKAWKSIRSTVLSNDGKWFAYVLAPNEGDASVVVRQTAQGATEQRFAIGELPAPAGNPFGGGGGPATLAISGDSKWVAFTIYPTQRDARRLRQQRRPVQNKIAVVNLASGQKMEFDKIRRFAFSGDKPQVIALYGYSAEPPAAGPTERGNGAAAAASASRSEGADLVLYTLTTGSVINIGNVGDFAFDESGNYPSTRTTRLATAFSCAICAPTSFVRLTAIKRSIVGWRGQTAVRRSPCSAASLTRWRRTRCTASSRSRASVRRRRRRSSSMPLAAPISRQQCE